MISIYRYKEGKREQYIRLTQAGKELIFLCFNLSSKGRVMCEETNYTYDLNIQIPLNTYFIFFSAKSWALGDESSLSGIYTVNSAQM